MQRIAHFLVGVLTAVGVTAQPGWQDITVAFAYYKDGIRTGPSELMKDPSFRLVLNGEQKQVGSYGSGSGNRSELCYASFEGHYFDEMLHADTLRMDIGHHGQWMHIVFPPRGLVGQASYTTRGLRIDFRPGRTMVTDLPKEVRVSGTVGNLEQIAAGNPYFDLMLRNGTLWSDGEAFDRTTGRFDAVLPCTTVMDGWDEWLNFTMVTRNWFGEVNSEMHMRTRYWTNIDLGNFDLVGSHFLFDGRELRIDADVQRDTLIAGAEEGSLLHITPINPSPSDTLKVEAHWGSSGAPVVSGYSTRKRRGVTEIYFTFSVRTDVTVATESWVERATVLELPTLGPGRYLLVQDPSKAENVRDVDLLLEREVPFIVLDRD